jgi:hypothetical protein
MRYYQETVFKEIGNEAGGHLAVMSNLAMPGDIFHCHKWENDALASSGQRPTLS